MVAGSRYVLVELCASLTDAPFNSSASLATVRCRGSATSSHPGDAFAK